MSTTTRVLACALSTVFAVACGAATSEPATPGGARANGSDTTSGTEVGATGASSASSVDEQLAVGARLYSAQCAGCHGDSGEGNAKAPALVGKNALPLDPQPPSRARSAKFRTAADVYEFAKKTMPPKNPGSLTDEQYAAILAFALKANGVDLGAAKVEPATASRFVLHP